jgi:hypothetical protein
MVRQFPIYFHGFTYKKGISRASPALPNVLRPVAARRTIDQDQ